MRSPIGHPHRKTVVLLLLRAGRLDGPLVAFDKSLGDRHSPDRSHCGAEPFHAPGRSAGRFGAALRGRSNKLVSFVVKSSHPGSPASASRTSPLAVYFTARLSSGLRTAPEVRDRTVGHPTGRRFPGASSSFSCSPRARASDSKSRARFLARTSGWKGSRTGASARSWSLSASSRS